MQRKIYHTALALSVAIFVSCTNADTQKSQSDNTAKNTNEQKMTNTVYDYSFRTLDGKEVKFSDYKGKKILIVNTASECGYTPQYEQLEDVYQQYRNKIEIVAFPTNDFGGQEPGTNEEIASFCKKNYGVTFPVSEKITVKGEETPALYQWLTKKELNGKFDSEVKWNFQKYLVDENGGLVAVYYSKVKPDAEEIKNEIER